MIAFDNIWEMTISWANKNVKMRQNHANIVSKLCQNIVKILSKYKNIKISSNIVKILQVDNRHVQMTISCADDNILGKLDIVKILSKWRLYKVKILSTLCRLFSNCFASCLQKRHNQ